MPSIVEQSTLYSTVQCSVVALLVLVRVLVALIARVVIILKIIIAIAKVTGIMMVI